MVTWEQEIWIFLAYSVLVLASAYVIAGLSRFLLRHAMIGFRKHILALRRRLRKQGVEVTERIPHFDETKYRVLSRLLVGLIYFIAICLIIYFVPTLRALSYSLLAGAGIAAIILGFGLQKTLANIFAGFFIALYEPFRIGDMVQVEGKYGVIEDINLRHTIIRNWEQRRWIIPNAIMSEAIVENFSIIDNRFLKTFTISVAYSADIDKVRKVILQEIKKNKQVIIPKHVEPGTRAQAEPFVWVTSWLESGVELRVGFWAPNIGTSWSIEFSLLEAIKKRFDKEGIEIPFPHRVMIHREDKRKKRR